MLDCLILGDSIAAGVGQARPGCVTVAKVGITSGTYMQTLFPTAPKAAETVVISLGVNDDPSMETLATLRKLRRAVQARHVVWLLPGLKDEVRRSIQTVAQEFADRTVDTKSQVGPDHLHPTGAGYRLIASWTEQGAPGGSGSLYASLPSRPFGPVQTSLTHQVTVGVLPRIVVPGMGLRWQPMIGAGSIYGSWPPANAPFAAIPPRDYAYRAVPTTTR